jgi:hypothetical protein
LTEQPSDSVEEDSGESVKSEDREQFNCFQENCDEVVRMESENQELVVESSRKLEIKISLLSEHCCSSILSYFFMCFFHTFL